LTGTNRYVKKITKNAITKERERLINGRRVCKKVWPIRLSARKNWKKLKPMPINVTSTDSNNRIESIRNEKIFIAIGVLIISAGNAILNPRWIEVKIQRPAHSKLSKPKTPIAVVFTLRRPNLIRKSLSKFSFTFFRNEKKFSEIRG
jgi:hypothetical protein